MAVVLKAEKKTNKGEEEEPQLIPGLPDDIAELCLLRVPYPYQSFARSVSSSWNRAITNPSFLQSKQTLFPSLSRPFLFVLTLHAQHRRLQWHALDLSSGSWFTLPAMPTPANDVSRAWRVSLASEPKQGMLRVVITSTSNTATPLAYHTVTNKWSLPPVANKAEYGAEIRDMEGQTWRAGSMEMILPTQYLMLKKRMKKWLLSGCGPGDVGYVEIDLENITGRPSRFTSLRVVLAGRTFKIGYPCVEVYDVESNVWPPLGFCVKVHDVESNAWQPVGEDRFPSAKLHKPFKAMGIEGRIYVASRGLKVAIGSTVASEKGVKLRWEVVEAPQSFSELLTVECQVLYA